MFGTDDTRGDLCNYSEPAREIMATFLYNFLVLVQNIFRKWRVTICCPGVQVKMEIAINRSFGVFP